MNRLIIASVLLAAVLAWPQVLTAGELAANVVKTRKIDNLRRFDGVVEAVNRSTISAQTSGRITEINFDVDDYVRAGEVILRFSDVEHKTRLVQAKAGLMAVVATRKGAGEDFKRVKKLFENGTVARARFDSAKSTFDAASARQKTAQAAVDQASEQLGYTIVMAPYSGFVVERHVQIGEVANPGQPLMTGFSLEKLRVRVAVPQRFAAAIRTENTATIEDDRGNSITATGLTVFPFADAESNTVTIRAALPEGTKSVFPGMLVKTAFKTGTTNVLTIADSSIVRRGEVIGVYLLGQGDKLHLQQIRTGRSSKGEVEVLSGLAEGDRIASDPLAATLLLKSGEDK